MQSGSGKLTANIVTEARQRFNRGERTSVLAREYGVPYSAMWNAMKGRTWKYTPKPPMDSAITTTPTDLDAVETALRGVMSIVAPNAHEDLERADGYTAAAIMLIATYNLAMAGRLSDTTGEDN